MRVAVWLFGRPLLEFSVDWEDDAGSYDEEEEPAPPARDPIPPSAPAHVPTLADTERAPERDPETRVIGFGYPEERRR